jgi:hypothetical protein
MEIPFVEEFGTGSGPGLGKQVLEVKSVAGMHP